MGRRGPEHQEDPERAERIRTLARLLETGLDDEEHTLGYHGTSLEAVRRIVETGKLDGGLQQWHAHLKHGPIPGDLYFFPRRANATSHPREGDVSDDEEAIGSAETYAAMLGRAHHFLAYLELPFNVETVEEAHSIFDHIEIAAKHARQFFLDRGIDAARIRKAERAAEHRQGIVLALHTDLLQSYTVLPTENTDPQWPPDSKIHCPDGLSYRLLAGLEPQGQDEWDFCKQLQQEADGME